MYSVKCVYVSKYSVCDLNVYCAMTCLSLRIVSMYMSFPAGPFIYFFLSRCVQYVVTGFLPAGTEALWQ